MDGTSYQKSGIISGGSHDLTRKAKRWDEKHMAQLKLQKEKYSEELKDLIKKSRKGSELSTVESQIKGLENRLKYSQKDLDASKKSIQQYDSKLAELEEELNAVGVSYIQSGVCLNLLYHALFSHSPLSVVLNAKWFNEIKKSKKSNRK